MSWILLSAGRGPAECEIAVAGLTRVLLAEAAACAVTAELLESVGTAHGASSVLVSLEGAGAGVLAARWTGTLKWICPSPLRPTWPRRNWFVGSWSLGVPGRSAVFDPSDVRFEACRASGPGGQHVNKVSSAIRATHVPSGLTVFAREERSQHRNRALALARLATKLAAQEAANAQAVKADRRTHHDDLERGNPIRTYRGRRFVLVMPPA